MRIGSSLKFHFYPSFGICHFRNNQNPKSDTEKLGDSDTPPSTGRSDSLLLLHKLTALALFYIRVMFGEFKTKPGAER